MEIIKKKDEMREIVEEEKARGMTVGLVPTMGFFHEGHLALMRRARADCDVVVVSLFVNPTQFGPGEDLEAYPRDFERDRALAESVGVDYIFAPEVEEMYPAGASTFVEVEEISGVMCGRSRPGHFRGVATVVAKLFNIMPAQKAYFGQKDAQQLVVIRKMAADLDIPVEVIPVPTVRESDGLAMSSRNTYLEPEERAQAVALYRSLEAARALVEVGERRAYNVSNAMEEVISTFPLVNLEYIFICDNIFLQPLEELSGEVLVAVAARIGRARLIDNMLLTVE
jgi:pantoate--beta-alanine ligase